MIAQEYILWLIQKGTGSKGIYSFACVIYFKGVFLIAKLKEMIMIEQFNPSALGVFLNPFYFARKDLYAAIASLSQHFHGRVLDIGCGQKPYEKLFKTVEYTGLEIDTPQNRETKKADFFYDGQIFPFEDKEFDGIFCSQVFEHIFNPEGFLKETKRVLKPEGMLLMTVPFIWDEHEQPFDYARYSSFGMQHLLSSEGFEIMSHRKTLQDMRIIFQIIIMYIYKTAISSNKYLNSIMILLLISPFNILGELLYRIFPKNKDLYLDNVILARKVK